MTSQKTGVSNRTPRKKYIDVIPTLKTSQFGNRIKGNAAKGKILDPMGKSYIIALTGPRGGVKTGTLAWLQIMAMAKGHTVYTNLSTKCFLVYPDGYKVLLETKDLDIEQLVLNTGELDGAFIGWDEYQQHDRSGMHMTKQHQLLISAWEQIRKFEITFCYVAKRINLIPGDIAWETDIEINCKDVSNSKREKEGSRCAWDIRDLSGIWTGRMFDPRLPVSTRATFYHRAIWGSYNTRQRFDPLEAQRGFKIDLEKRLITDKDQTGNFVDEEQYQEIKQEAQLVISDGPVRRSEFFATVDVTSAKVKGYIQARLKKELGIEEFIRGGIAWLRFAGTQKKVGRPKATQAAN